MVFPAVVVLLTVVVFPAVVVLLTVVVFPIDAVLPTLEDVGVRPLAASALAVAGDMRFLLDRTLLMPSLDF